MLFLRKSSSIHQIELISTTLDSWSRFYRCHIIVNKKAATLADDGSVVQLRGEASTIVDQK